MLKRWYAALILVLVCVTIAAGVYYYMKPPKKIYSGFWRRGREALSPDYEVNLTKQLASSIGGTSPAGLWVVGLVSIQRGTCTLTFPSNQTYLHMVFEDQDINEDYLIAFDDNGIKIWLEVEPGFADVDQLIDLVLERYGHHPCILGVGIDLEWRWGLPDTRETVPVTDEEANRWLNRIKRYNTNYRLLLIHWVTEVMPPTVRKDIVFVDDAQSFEGLDQLVDEFKLWGEHFSQGDVGYVFGYRRDYEWLSELENPPREIGLALIKNIPNCRFVFWSQETILEVFHQ